MPSSYSDAQMPVRTAVSIWRYENALDSQVVKKIAKDEN
jgi:hypothetical protein